MTPQEVLTNVRKAYRSCKTYKDRGDVVTVFIHAGGRRQTTSRPFQTSFVRPDLFRFEFAERAIGPEEEWDRYVIWKKQGVTHCWWTIQGVEEAESLEMAIAGATGVSGGSAYRVPRLLLPELGEHEVALRLEPDQIVAGRPCMMLVQGQAGHEETWAVDETTWQLLQVTERHVFDKAQQERQMQEAEHIFREMEASGRMIRRPQHHKDFSTETKTTYVPVFDVEISEEEFDFQPPSQIE